MEYPKNKILEKDKMSDWLQIILIVETMMFLCGFLYALAIGRKDMFWLRRGLCGGFAFALFYIVLPIALLEDAGLFNKKK
jgi:ATP/ADP translocase